MPRKSISLEQRRALRSWANKQHPRPSQRACIQWFQSQFNRQISQSTVSESLSSHFADLDKPIIPSQDRARLRVGHWPDLEQVLYLWQKRVEEEGGITSGELLQLKARQIWTQLPIYEGKPCPNFSKGWLYNFQQRFGITEHIRHGEAGSVPDVAEVEMAALRTLAGEYNEEDVYNMDETGLYWRMMPCRGLSTQAQPGIKKDKTRISIAICCNSVGNDRLPLWIIGKAKTPRALRGISVTTMGAQWRFNKKAWMNSTIMVEWLQAFYTYIGTTRRVLLTLDNFSAHTAAIELAPPPSNIRICWLPANSTSLFQPLDQGVIQCFKSHYRRQWLLYMLEHFEQGLNPMESMNIHLAIRWAIQSWNHFVSNTTIYNCFRKSTLMDTPITLTTPIDPPDINQVYTAVLRAGNIQDFMSISNFLNPIDEAIIDTDVLVDPEEVLEDVISEHLGLQQGLLEEEEEIEEIQPVYTLQDARQAIRVLIEYTERSEDASTTDLRAIERYSYHLEAIERNGRIQSTLDRWLT